MIGPDHEPEHPEPNGLLVRLALILEGRELCIERFFFFGRDHEKEAMACFTGLLEDAHEGRLDDGIYLLSKHPAWEGNEDTPHDYDAEEHSIQFQVKKTAVVTLLRER